MKNIFNKTNAPYLAIGTLATLALLASGVFAAAPYIGFLAPVAALSVGLPFIIGGAIISAVAIALLTVVINKNNIISQKEAEAQFYKDKLSTQELTSLDYLDPAVPSKKQEQQADKKVDYLDLATSKNLNHLNVDISSLKEQSAKDEIYEDAVKEQVTKVSSPENQQDYDASSGDEKDTKVSSPANEPAKEETKVNGYLNQAVSEVNWIAGKATKAMPYLAASYLPYVFYNYATTPVSASFDDVNLTQSFVANSGITSPIL